MIVLLPGEQGYGHVEGRVLEVGERAATLSVAGSSSRPILSIPNLGMRRLFPTIDRPNRDGYDGQADEKQEQEDRQHRQCHIAPPFPIRSALLEAFLRTGRGIN